jgi:hypothetical protein
MWVFSAGFWIGVGVGVVAGWVIFKQPAWAKKLLDKLPWRKTT